MQTCPQCSRHVWEGEPRCPFCSASFTHLLVAAPVVLSALVGLTLVACGGDPGDETTAATTSASQTATEAVTSTQGASNTSSQEMTGTASSALTTTGVPPDSTSTGPDSASGSEGTSTSSAGTSSSDGTSSASAGESSSTGDPDTGTTLASTGGDCTGRGEKICDGVCVDTQADDENCGECNHACDKNMGETCFGGECMVFLPYGAPTPDPVWV